MAKDNLLEKDIQSAVEGRAATNKTTGQDYIDNLKADLSRNSLDTRAVSELQELVNLIVITHQQNIVLKSGMWEFISQFIVEPNTQNGNGRRFILHYPQTGRNWTDVENSFLPTEKTKEKFVVQFIKFKQDNGQPMPKSNQFVFDITYRTPDLITYFINGQLMEFVQDEIIGKIGQSIEITLYDTIMKELVNPYYSGTSGVKIGKQITGTARNLFDALTNEVFVECKEMLQNSSDYNVKTGLTNAINASRKEDLIMIASPKTISNIQSHLMSQLFNSSKIELSNYVGSVHVANRKFQPNTADGTWNTATSAYVDDNTIIVIDRANYFKCMKMLEFSGSQDYPLNMSSLRVSHLWFAKDKLDWGKCFFYTNNNLNVMPGNEA